MINNVLVVAPHPDDEVLGCGATIHKLAHDNFNVTVLIITRGDPQIFSAERISKVRNEAINAHKILGVKETRFLDYIAPKLDITSKAEISRSIANVIKELNIQILFLPHRGDIHHDHRVVFEAALVAARPVNDCPVKRIYSYETLSETEWSAPFASEAFLPNVFFEVEKSLEYKIKAMECYKTQIKEFPNPRSVEMINALALSRGSASGLMAAEAFILIREIKE